METDPKYDIPFEQEVYRKMIHLLSLSIPLIYIFINRELAIAILFPLTIIDLFFEILYKINRRINHLINSIWGMMLRPYEKKEKTVFTGATWVFISALLIIAFFPKFIAVTALTILVISDISAALIGRKFGKTKFLGKSLEGTLAFFITGIMIIIVYGIIFHASWTYFLFGFISVIVGAFFESISKSIKLDDNFTIPLSISIFMWLGELISVYFNCSYANLI